MKLTIPAGPFAGYIFDCDGTLADTMPLHYRAWKRLVEELGGSFSEQLFQQWGGRPTARILELLRDGYGLAVGIQAAEAAGMQWVFVPRNDSGRIEASPALVTSSL